MYTFWDYMRNRWERDGGPRLDHILLSSALKERLQDAGVDRHVRGLEGASDHAAVWVKLRDEPDRLRRFASTCERPEQLRRRRLREGDGTHRIGEGDRKARRAARIGQPALSGRPLLVIDGNSFAHRSYHALPKTIRRSDGKGSRRHPWLRPEFLLRLYADERPRAVIVGWDSLA